MISFLALPDPRWLSHRAGTTGQRVLLRFFETEERARWARERDLLRAIATTGSGGVEAEGQSGDRLIAGLVDAFYDSGREAAGLPPFCIVVEAGEATLRETMGARQERQDEAGQSRFAEYGRGVSMMAQMLAPSAMRAHAAMLPTTRFTPAEVRFIARCAAETLYHLHSICRVSLAALDAVSAKPAV